MSVGIARSFSFLHLVIRHKLGVALLLLVALAPLAAYLLRPPSASDLSESDPSYTQALLSEWNEGDVIVLVRHLERCSRVDAACLDGPTGITARAQDVGYDLGEDFRDLGLENADILNSPLTRTAQTSSLLFNQTTENQDWLYKCDGSILKNALARKVPGRNLILVTHSSCMDELETAFKLSDVYLDYGSSLFMATDNKRGNRILGFIDAPDWHKVFGS
jgi:phosphohistidine phosphatase SixA